MSHEVDWARVGKMPIKELSLSWLISAGESKSRIQWILLTKKRHGIFRSENTKVQRVIGGEIWVIFLLTLSWDAYGSLRLGLVP